MGQTVPATAILGPGKTGLTIGYRVLNVDGTSFSAFSTASVAETLTAGTYRVAGGVVAPDAGGYVIFGTALADLAEATIEYSAMAALAAYDPPTNAEMEARTLAAASYATAAALAAVDGIVDDILIDTGATIPAQVAALNNLSAAQVNAEVVDALNVDAYAEPGQGAPGTTISLAAKINYIYKAWRNKKTQTASTFTLYADDGATADQKATTSDDGTTFVSGEVVSGV